MASIFICPAQALLLHSRQPILHFCLQVKYSIQTELPFFSLNLPQIQSSSSHLVVAPSNIHAKKKLESFLTYLFHTWHSWFYLILKIYLESSHFLPPVLLSRLVLAILSLAQISVVSLLTGLPASSLAPVGLFQLSNQILSLLSSKPCSDFSQAK